MRIGFIGLGNMGAAMAANLIATGHEVTVYNRSAAKADALVERGARRAVDIADAGRAAEVVFTMLADDEAVRHAALGDAGEGGLVDALPPGAVHVSSSTISLDLAQQLADSHAERGQLFVSAPVFGRPEAAVAAKLFVIAAGAPAAIDIVTPLLAVIGQRTFVVSDQPPAANLVKLSGNFLIANVIESIGEAMALVSKAGVDKHAYLEILTSTLFDAPVYKTYGTLIADERFSPAGFAAPLGLKDIRLVLEAGEALRVPLPIAGLLRDRFLALIAGGGAALDWSAIATLAARDAGAGSDHPA